MQDDRAASSTAPYEAQQTTTGKELLNVSCDGRCYLCCALSIAVLDINDLGDVLEAVWEARARWYIIGLKLGTSPGTLDAIKTGAKENPDDCIMAMIKDWLNNGKPRPTWAAVAKALKSPMVGYAHLAELLPPRTT